MRSAHDQISVPFFGLVQYHLPRGAAYDLCDHLKSGGLSGLDSLDRALMVCLIAPISPMTARESIPPFSLRRLALAPLLPLPREGNSRAKTQPGSAAPPSGCASVSTNTPRDLRKGERR